MKGQPSFSISGFLPNCVAPASDAPGGGRRTTPAASLKRNLYIHVRPGIILHQGPHPINSTPWCHQEPSQVARLSPHILGQPP